MADCVALALAACGMRLVSFAAGNRKTCDEMWTLRWQGGQEGLGERREPVWDRIWDVEHSIDTGTGRVTDEFPSRGIFSDLEGLFRARVRRASASALAAAFSSAAAFFAASLAACGRTFGTR